MLTSTYLHIPGIGPKTEQRLWDAGLENWSAVLAHCRTPLSIEREAALVRHIETSYGRFVASDAHYFSQRLPPRHLWRLFPEFRHATAYLDIETNGWNAPYNDITVIGLYDGTTIRHYVMGDNLHEFPDAVSQFKVIVTFNGRCFDVPFIERFFRTRLDLAHIDLRYVLQGLGFRGGLKRCEQHLGIDRGNLKDLDGFSAVLLWREFLGGRNHRALETLLAYNTHDIIHLETLAVEAYNRKLSETPFRTSHRLARPLQPRIPFQADPGLVAQIKAKAAAYLRTA